MTPARRTHHRALATAVNAAESPAHSFLDPAIMAQLAHLPLTARFAMEGSVSGHHRSPHRGSSVEFAEYRAYVPGDDLRRLDWRVLGRTDRGFQLGRLSLAEPLSDSLVRVRSGMTTQQWYGLGGTLRWEPTNTLRIEAEALFGARRLNLVNGATDEQWKAGTIAATGGTGFKQTSSTLADGQHFTVAVVFADREVRGRQIGRRRARLVRDRDVHVVGAAIGLAMHGRAGGDQARAGKQGDDEQAGTRTHRGSES